MARVYQPTNHTRHPMARPLARRSEPRGGWRLLGPALLVGGLSLGLLTGGFGPANPGPTVPAEPVRSEAAPTEAKPPTGAAVISPVDEPTAAPAEPDLAQPVPPAPAAAVRTDAPAPAPTVEAPTKPLVRADALYSFPDLVERGSTSFAGSTPEKQHNIRVAAQKLDGTIVPAGGTFSFNRAIGPTTLDTGFTWGFGITSAADGVRTVPSVAGGICQVATTLFHAVFWGGYPVEQRHAHLYWVPAYTSKDLVGLDVTVDEEYGLDFTWTNPAPTPLLVRATVDDATDTLEVALYGRKPDWTVKVAEPTIANRRAADPRPVTRQEPALARGRVVQVESARAGFDVTVTRTVIGQGDRPRSLTLRSAYQPSRTVTLVGTGGTSAPIAAQPPRAGA